MFRIINKHYNYIDKNCNLFKYIGIKNNISNNKTLNDCFPTDIIHINEESIKVYYSNILNYHKNIISIHVSVKDNNSIINIDYYKMD